MQSSARISHHTLTPFWNAVIILLLFKLSRWFINIFFSIYNNFSRKYYPAGGTHDETYFFLFLRVQYVTWSYILLHSTLSQIDLIAACLTVIWVISSRSIYILYTLLLCFSSAPFCFYLQMVSLVIDVCYNI